MYVDHYNLIEEPFKITPDPKFVWLGEKHAEALATMEYGIDENKGFLVLTGDVGTGKTLMVNCLLNRIDTNTIAVKVQHPTMAPLDFFNFLAAKLGWEKSFHTKGKFLLHFENYLYQTHSENKRLLFIIDEAHKISDQILEEIRLLSNIELEYEKLLNVFIVGQIELERVLNKEKNKALRERIAIWYHIDPLTEKETGQYIRTRLAVAGAKNEIFDSDAIREIYLFSKGVPRQINILCDHALLTGFSSDIKEIGAQVVVECAQDLKMISSMAEKDIIEGKPIEKTENRLSDKEIDVKAKDKSAQDVKVNSGTAETGNSEQKVSEKKGLQSFVFERKNRLPSSQVFTGLSMILLIVIGFVVYHFQPWAREDTNVKILQTSPANKESTPVKQVTHSEDLKAQMQKWNNDRIISDRVKQDAENEQRAFLEIPAVSKNTSTVEQKDESYFQKMNFVIHFNHNSNELHEGAVQKLDRIIEFMTRNPDTRIEVKGYTDNSGNQDYNLYISELRANLIKTYLTSKGIHNSRIETKGLGPENPIASNETLEGKKLNRRVEIEFYSKNSL
jgi:general secretion pathway protein A